MDELAEFARAFSMSMQAARIRDFGWEPTVNEYSPERLRELARHLPEHAETLRIAAEQKEADHGAT